MRAARLRRVATVWGARSAVEMEVWTTEPGLQFYDGVGVARDVPGLEGDKLRRAWGPLP